MDNFEAMADALRVQLANAHKLKGTESAQAYSNLTLFLVRGIALAAYSSLNDKGIHNLANELKDLFLGQVSEVEIMSEQIMKNLTSPTEH